MTVQTVETTPRRIPTGFQRDLIVVGVLFLTVAALYSPSLKYPFVWYDADDLLRAIKYSPANLFSGVANYQYYRPLIFLLWKLILAVWGADSAPIFHAWLIGAHVLNSVLLYALARTLTLRRSIAAVTALLFAVYPFSYQAVTWIIAHQPPSMIFVLAGLLIYTRARITFRNQRASVIHHVLAITCLIAAMLMHESAFVSAGLVMLIEAYLFFTRRVPRLSLWPLLYIVITIILYVIYSSAAKSSPPQATFQLMTGLYLLQGLVYPAAMLLARVCQSTGCDSTAWLLPVSLVVVSALLISWRSNRTVLLGLFGLLWFGGSILPMWAGRDFVYNEYAPRLLYLAGAGAALAIAAAIGPIGASAQSRISAGRLASLGVLTLIILQSGQFVLARQPLHDDAFRLLEQENRAMFTPRSGSALFVDTVELFTYQENEFPLGWFGVLVSPWHNHIVTDLNLRAENADWVIDPAHSQQVQDRSRLKLEFHGRVASPEQLRQAIATAREVYRVEATPDANLHVFQIAAIEHQADPATSFVTEWANSVRLITATVEMEANMPVLNLDWSIAGAIDSHQTVFVHVQNVQGQIVAQADGDPIGGYAPLGSWTVGDRIRERRPLILPGNLAAGTYSISLGLYDRATLLRVIPTQATLPINEGAVAATTFDLH